MCPSCYSYSCLSCLSAPVVLDTPVEGQALCSHISSLRAYCTTTYLYSFNTQVPENDIEFEANSLGDPQQREAKRSPLKIGRKYCTA